MLPEVLEEMGLQSVSGLLWWGTEFDSIMQEMHGPGRGLCDKSAAYSPSQNGMAERLGGIWKTIFKEAFQESAPTNKQEVGELVDHVTITPRTL